MTGVKESGDAVLNIILPVMIILHDLYGSGSLIVWGGILFEGCTDLDVIANGTLTAVRYWYETLREMVRPYAGAVSPGFLLDAIDWPFCSPDLYPI